MYLQALETMYYIPFSKKNVDEIIANSAKTDKYSIKYTVKFGSEDSTDAMVSSSRNQFSYDMFMWPWDKLYEWQHWPIEDIDYATKAKQIWNEPRIQT